MILRAAVSFYLCNVVRVFCALLRVIFALMLRVHFVHAFCACVFA